VKIHLLLLLALLVSAEVARADIYRYLSEDGQTVFTDVPPTHGPYEVMLKTGPVAAKSGAPLGAAARGEVRDIRRMKGSRFARDIDEAARANAIDPALIHAVITAESGYNPGAMSRKGAAGLMQLMPETARRYNVMNRFDPVQSIHGGARYLGDLLRMFNNDLRLAVAAYNAGENAVIKYGNRIPPYAETVAYVPRVLAYYREYRPEG
jgi:soluble lytic murein transglycosylase-like protein